MGRAHFAAPSVGRGAHARENRGCNSRPQAAALRDGHAVQNADRLAATRARRAAAVRDVNSAGTASPIPKYISSGVCPRNVEWGSRRRGGHGVEPLRENGERVRRDVTVFGSGDHCPAYVNLRAC